MDLPRAEAEFREDSGVLPEFWDGFFARAAAATGASRIAYLIRSKTGSKTGGGNGWETLHAWPAGAGPFPASGAGADAEVHRLGAEAQAAGLAVRRYPAGAGWVHLAAIVAPDALLLLRFDRLNDEAALAGAARAAALACMPEFDALRREKEELSAARARLARVLDLVLLLEPLTSFPAAAMLICNELAAALHCDRVSLGWIRGRYVRLRAVSHTEQFLKSSGAVQAIELMMEEALDQDDEIGWPSHPEDARVLRAHKDFAAAGHAAAIATIPLRIGDRLTGALCLERARPFEPEDWLQLRLIADQVTPRLDTLEQHSRWLGARAVATLRRGAASLVGHEHTGAKFLALAVAAVLAALALTRVTYHVQAPFHLQCDQLAQLPAPFDGYIEEVHARSGDAVHTGDVLVSLDKRELLQQQAAALAELHQHEAEREAAESDQKIADMRVASAAAEQSRASLQLVQLRLEQVDLRAPFDGYVVEGDLRQRIGAPVKQGEVMLKVARINSIHPAIEVAERDIQEVRPGAVGSLAFASQPQVKFAIAVERLQPVAEDTPHGNIFIADARFSSDPQPWWRPGMSGVARVDADRRSLLWIITHRTADFLRLKLWW
jgi:multidrug efflux pump subunit AcrA (membrane-fusion protein)